MQSAKAQCLANARYVEGCFEQRRLAKSSKGLFYSESLWLGGRLLGDVMLPASLTRRRFHCSDTFLPAMSTAMRGNFRMLRGATAALLGGALMAALGGCADNGPPSGQPSFYIDLATTDAALDANAAQSMISGYRGNNGLGAVTLDPELMRLAGEQARVMAAHDKLDHDVGRPFQDRIRKSGFDAAVAVENISAGYHTMAEAFSGWRDSPPHRANMLNSNVTKMGIAAVYAPKSKYKVFWSLILAKPDEKRG
jgi:uncharacterized protein YkwD